MPSAKIRYVSCLLDDSAVGCMYLHSNKCSKVCGLNNGNEFLCCIPRRPRSCRDAEEGSAAPVVVDRRIRISSTRSFLQRFALCKARVNFESETKSPPREHDFSSISRWIALKIEIRTYLKISEVLPYSFSREILSKKIVSDRVALNSRTQFRDNGGLLAFDM